MPAALAGLSAVGLAGAAIVLCVRGSLTLDLGVGRSRRALGPFTVRVAAPRDAVFELLAGPYLAGRPGSGPAVLERGPGMALAAHTTAVTAWLSATTVETVRFERPSSVRFRLVRGPVPCVVERIDLEDAGPETVLLYRGELETDLWAAGRAWGTVVARRWEAAVESHLRALAAEAERIADGKIDPPRE